MLFSLSHVFGICMQDYLISCKTLAAAPKVCDRDVNRRTNISGAQRRALAGQCGQAATLDLRTVGESFSYIVFSDTYCNLQYRTCASWEVIQSSRNVFFIFQFFHVYILMMITPQIKLKFPKLLLKILYYTALISMSRVISFMPFMDHKYYLNYSLCPGFTLSCSVSELFLILLLLPRNFHHYLSAYQNLIHSFVMMKLLLYARHYV